MQHSHSRLSAGSDGCRNGAPYGCNPSRAITARERRLIRGAIDTIVSDFAAGAAEALSPDNDQDHWDVIEGQGSLFHPAYAAVSLALLHGSQPDAIVLCHDPGRTHIDGFPDFGLPTLEACIEANLAAARLTNKAVRAAGIALDTSRLSASDRGRIFDQIATRTGLPVVDPIATGTDAIVDRLLSFD